MNRRTLREMRTRDLYRNLQRSEKESVMSARSKQERALRREDRASGQRERKNSQRTGKSRGVMAPSGQAKSAAGGHTA